MSRPGSLRPKDRSFDRRGPSRPLHRRCGETFEVPRRAGFSNLCGRRLRRARCGGSTARYAAVIRRIKSAADERFTYLDRLLSACPFLDELPNLTTFDCFSCGDPWPCPAAKGQLSVLSTAQRGLLLGAVMGLASYRLPIEGLYARFLYDVRRP